MYTHKINGRTFQVSQMWAVKDENAYIISFGSTSTSYLFYNPLVHEIIESFDINAKDKLPHFDNNIKYLNFISEKGISIKYPNDWILAESSKRISFISG